MDTLRYLRDFLASVGSWISVDVLSRLVLPSPFEESCEPWAQQIVSSVHALTHVTTATRAVARLASLGPTLPHSLFGLSNIITLQLNRDIGYYSYDTLVDVLSWYRSGKLKNDDLVCYACSQ